MISHTDDDIRAQAYVFASNGVMYTINPNDCYKTKRNILKYFHLNVNVQPVLACIYHNILHSTSNNNNMY